MNTRRIHVIAMTTMAGLLLIGCGGGQSARQPTGVPSVSSTAPTTSTATTRTTQTTEAAETAGSVEPATAVSTTLVAETSTTAVATTLPIEATNRPAVFAEFPLVTLLGPAQTNAGVGPTFEWTPVDGATSYRLSVVGPDGPIWVWEGTETTVALALRPDPRPASAPALEIVAGSSWSVAALDAAGDLIAISGNRPVSPAA